MNRILFATVSLVSILFMGCPKEDGYVASWPQNTVEVRDYNEGMLFSGPLRIKADNHDTWNAKWHQPYHGGNVDIKFTDASHTIVESAEGLGDSCIWTGTYLGSQAMRYYVTGEPVAKDNVIKTFRALDGYLHVTGAPGYIARYWGRQDSIEYEKEKNGDGCHAVNEGPYAGDFWLGNTSRDQYTGWFFGMSLAYDLVDDDWLKNEIRADVKDVIDMLMDRNWNITAEDGKPSKVAPAVLAGMKLNFLVIGYHMTGDERMREQLRQLLLNVNRTLIWTTDINWLNRYSEYFGNNLAHTNWYNLLRLGKAYFGEDDYKWLVKEFNQSVHTFTRLSHNAWFNGIYMSQGGWEKNLSVDNPYYNQLITDLGDFWPAPNVEFFQPARDPVTYEIDPVSVWLYENYNKMDWLKKIWGGTDGPQAKEAFPVRLQCSEGFVWQRNPFRIQPCGSDNPRYVQPGVDYLVAYWLASYHKFLVKGM